MVQSIRAATAVGAPAGTPASPSGPARGIRNRRLSRAATIVIAALAAFLIWVISVPALGLTLTVGSGAFTQDIGLPSVILVPILAGSLAWALLALFERMFRRGHALWKITGWVVLAVSLLGPLSMGGSVGVLATLLLMHLTVGATLMLGLPGTLGLRGGAGSPPRVPRPAQRA